MHTADRHKGIPRVMPAAGTGKLIDSRTPMYRAQRVHLEAMPWETYLI